MLAPFLLALTLTAQAVPAAATVAAPAEAALSPEQMAHFLETAKVVGHHGINKGITNPIRLTLTDGTVTHDAAFTYVNEHRAVMQLDSGRTELNFVDSYKYSLAAYYVAKMLALDGMMPVTVPYQYRLDAGRALVVGRREDGRRRTREEEDRGARRERLGRAGLSHARVLGAHRRHRPERGQHPDRAGLEALDDRLHARVPHVEEPRKARDC